MITSGQRGRVKRRSCKYSWGQQEQRGPRNGSQVPYIDEVDDNDDRYIVVIKYIVHHLLFTFTFPFQGIGTSCTLLVSLLDKMWAWLDFHCLSCWDRLIRVFHITFFIHDDHTDYCTAGEWFFKRGVAWHHGGKQGLWCSYCVKMKLAIESSHLTLDAESNLNLDK